MLSAFLAGVAIGVFGFGVTFWALRRMLAPAQGEQAKSAAVLALGLVLKLGLQLGLLYFLLVKAKLDPVGLLSGYGLTFVVVFGFLLRRFYART